MSAQAAICGYYVSPLGSGSASKPTLPIGSLAVIASNAAGEMVMPIIGDALRLSAADEIPLAQNVRQVELSRVPDGRPICRSADKIVKRLLRREIGT